MTAVEEDRLGEYLDKISQCEAAQDYEPIKKKRKKVKE
jgi:hypothetical protein